MEPYIYDPLNIIDDQGSDPRPFGNDCDLQTDYVSYQLYQMVTRGNMLNSKERAKELFDLHMAETDPGIKADLLWDWTKANREYTDYMLEELDVKRTLETLSEEGKDRRLSNTDPALPSEHWDGTIAEGECSTDSALHSPCETITEQWHHWKWTQWPDGSITDEEYMGGMTRWEIPCENITYTYLTGEELLPSPRVMAYGGTTMDIVEATGATNGFYTWSLGAGNDIFLGGLSDDEVYLGDGNDYLRVSGGQDDYYGGNGVDTIDASWSVSNVNFDLSLGRLVFSNGSYWDMVGFENVYGTQGSNTIAGDAQDNVLRGMEGNDVLFGGYGRDDLFGGDGNDVITGGGDHDNMFGDDGTDSLYGGSGDDLLSGGTGADVLNGGTGSDYANYMLADSAVVVSLSQGGFAGEAVGDTFVSIENLIGSDYDDVLIGNTQNNIIIGGMGSDVLSGDAGDDILIGGEGYDALAGGLGSDVLHGGEGTDIAYYFDAAAGQVIDMNDRTNTATNSGEHMNDIWKSIEGVYGANNFSNVLIGDDQDNLFLGGAQGDQLYGGDGSDVLTASGGDDTVFGGNGNDFMSGDAGTDVLTGGAGEDVFYIFSNSGIDIITDFEEADDTLLFYQAGANQWSDLTMAEVGSDVHITHSGSAYTVIVENVGLADLDNTDNFMFM